MSKNKFLEWGNPILYKSSKAISKSELNSSNVKAIAKKMLAAIKGVGIGLAAVQIGELKRIIVVDLQTNKSRPEIKEGLRIVAINPKIIWKSKESEDGWEGNLCMPGVIGIVRRAKKIKVRYWNEEGEKVEEALEGFPARVFQHECEQLEGKNFIHSMPDPTKLITRREYVKRFTRK